MDKPFFNFSLAAFESSVVDLKRILPADALKEFEIEVMRTGFRRKIDTAQKALSACKTGRQIQIAELKAAILEAIADFEFDVANNKPIDERRRDFWSLVGPHLDPANW